MHHTIKAGYHNRQSAALPQDGWQAARPAGAALPSLAVVQPASEASNEPPSIQPAAARSAHMPPAAFLSRNLAMGEAAPSGSSSSSLVLPRSTNATVTP